MKKATLLNVVHMDSVKLLTKTSNAEIDIIYVADQACATNIRKHLVHQHVCIHSIITLFPKKKRISLIF
jgi:hypothetical protein